MAFVGCCLHWIPVGKDFEQKNPRGQTATVEAAYNENHINIMSDRCFCLGKWVYFGLSPLPSNGDHKYHHLKVIFFPFNYWRRTSTWEGGQPKVCILDSNTFCVILVVTSQCPGWGSSISLPFPRLPKHLVRRYAWTPQKTHTYQTPKPQEVLLMEEILHHLICGLSHYLHDFIDPRWLFGISSINSMTGRLGFCTTLGM